LIDARARRLARQRCDRDQGNDGSGFRIVVPSSVLPLAGEQETAGPALS